MSKFVIVMEKTKKISSSILAKKAASIKMHRKLESIEDAPFFKKKMQKGAGMLATAGLPK